MENTREILTISSLFSALTHREPDVNGPKYPLGHIQPLGVLGMENWGQLEVTWIYFGKSKR